MNIKHLMTTSVIALASSSVAQAADILIPPHEVAAQVVAAPAFSWAGFYLGAQIGNLSSKVKMHDESIGGAVDKDRTPHPSGFMGGAYTGFNIDLGRGIVLGIETDAVWADRKDEAKTFSGKLDDKGAEALNFIFEDAGHKFKDDAEKFVEGDHQENIFTYKEKWSGATRIRVGFAVGENVLPYVSGGVAYAQMRGLSKITGTKKPAANTDEAKFRKGSVREDSASTTEKPPLTGGSSGGVPDKPGTSGTDNNPGTSGTDNKPIVSGSISSSAADKPIVSGSISSGAADKPITYDPISREILDQEVTMVGYTIGAGLDFAMTDNVVLRAEYRYSDFGKKKFDDKSEFKYRTNDFRVGVAYKF